MIFLYIIITGYISKNKIQMAVTITEILGTDSITGARLTINSNFLLLENAYNDFENTFNINVLTGSMDVSSASSGQIKSRALVTNSLVMPSSGSPTVQIYGTGASAGYVIASSTIAGDTGIFSNNLQANLFSASGAATFGATGTFNAAMVCGNKSILGPSGSIINQSRKASVGSTTTFPTAPGAGVTGSYDNPYDLTLTENVLYIDSSYVSASTTGPTGFFMRSTTGPGTAVSNIPAGYTLTLIDVAATPGLIVTGLTGDSSYYTGFNDIIFSSGNFPTPGNPYISTLTLMWEPRIEQGASTQKGSWVVISSTPGYTF